MAMEYSNLGYALLGRIIANVSGQPYKDFVARLLLTPLGMASTGYDVAASPRSVARSATVGKTMRGSSSRRWRTARSARWAGMQTSATDYAKWVAYLLSAWPPRDGADAGPVRRSSVRELAHGANFPRCALRAGATGTDRLPAGRDLRDGLHRRRRLRSRPDAEPRRRLSRATARTSCCCPTTASASSRFANRTYAGPRPPVWDAAMALQRAGLLKPRPVPASTALTTAYAAVGKIFAAGSITAGGDVLAMNMPMDRDAEHWARDFAALKAGVGSCDTAAPITPTAALSGEFTWTCERGRVNGSLLLAPTREPRIQALELSRATP